MKKNMNLNEYKKRKVEIIKRLNSDEGYSNEAIENIERYCTNYDEVDSSFIDFIDYYMDFIERALTKRYEYLFNNGEFPDDEYLE